MDSHVLPGLLSDGVYVRIVLVSSFVLVTWKFESSIVASKSNTSGENALSMT